VTLKCLRNTAAGVEIFLYVQPRASRSKIAGIQGEELKVALTAPPVDGAANKACRIFLARLCNIPRSRVLLVAGETSRHKRLLLEGANLRQIEALLEDLLGA
jgi:uncharacterized protein (TIGR00251 family)